MRNFEAEIHAYVAEKLFAVAVEVEYPVHTCLGLDAFFQSFEEDHIEIMHDDHRKVFIRRFGRPLGIVQGMLNDVDILAGWHQHPFASVKSLNDSVYTLGKALWEDVNERDVATARIGERLDAHLQEVCGRYQENFFIGRDGNNPLLRTPSLLNNLIKEKDLAEHYRQLIIDYGLERDMQPVERHGYHPAVIGLLAHTMTGIIVKLAEQKGYVFVDDTNRYNSILKKGWKKALVHASELWPSNRDYR
ncbi:MAG: hypothetical protein Q7R96_04450 [Nanoarchaeota archaeon]|nr:hypothetical protein [Nanoarchaeota archaeon]